MEEKMGEEQREKKPVKKRKGVPVALRILQHIALAVGVVSLFVVTIGSQMRIKGLKYYVTYDLYESDQNKEYEESELFNNIFGFSLADIIRFGVISSQLETDGKFDGGKVIDITAYNYREAGLPEQYVTADYYLEDLLKWDSYGFETTLLETDADSFLADRTRVTSIDQSSAYYNTSDANYLKSDINKYTFVNDVSANMVQLGGDDTLSQVTEGESYVTTDEDGNVIVEEQYTEADNSWDPYEILVNRYKTVEGKNLEEYVSDWDLYYGLLQNLEKAAGSLTYNYNEYLTCRDYYSTEKSNVRFLIAKQVGDDVQYYTNMKKQADVDAVVNAMEKGESGFDSGDLPAEKYLYYSPAEMTYKTNTKIAKGTVRDLIAKYDYAYPETVKIWMGVDTQYPVNDSFTQGEAGFRNYLPHFWQWILVTCAAFLLYFGLLIYSIWGTGVYVDADGRREIRMNGFDRIPTEAALGIAFFTAGICAWILMISSVAIGNGNQDSSSWYETVIYTDGFKLALGLIAFAMDAIAMFFFYSLVRRIKAGTLWKNSYLRRLARRVKKLLWHVYDNGNIVIRTWIPYCIFLLFNGLMLYWTVSAGSILPFLIAGVMDLAVGVLLYRDTKERQGIVDGIENIAAGELEYQVDTKELHGDNLTLAHSVNSIGKGIKDAVEISMKDERMKADLITNVSHDIKTPLTSIINYVDLIKRENVDNEKVKGYIRVLDEKSQRLKQLTDDLVEASKISSGNIQLTFEKINLTELMNQTIGEFSEKFEQKNLTTVMNVNAANTVIEADSRRIWRVMENLFNNIFKYAMDGTRVYVAIDPRAGERESIEISIKNISASPLNCNPEELTERFIRGDVSRTTEGSGLGLSIAKNLTEAQGGTFEILLDGDLFKVIMTFPLAK